VGHDAHIGNCNVINPGVNISGGVKLGDRILVGTGCQILENVNIGNDAVVGAGAMVRTDVESGLTVVGVPAQPIRRRSSALE
jgi:serine acetyltransferase